MIYIIIPNYNGLEHLEACLESLRKQTYSDYIIAIVDNGSTDRSVEFIKINYPGVSIIELKKNYGFAKAVNIGIKSAMDNDEVTHIVLLNNDIECDHDFLSEMLNGFKNDKIGSVACKMFNFYNRNVIDDTGNFVDIKDLPYIRGQGSDDHGQYDKDEFIFGACAGAATYKKEVFEIAGLFDEDYISYFEDIDYSFRLQYCGYKCFYNHKAICYHKRGATGLSNIPFCRFLIEKNIILLRIKNYPLLELIKYLPFYIFSSYYRCFRDIKWYSIKTSWYSFKGTFMGLGQAFKAIKKRTKIMKNSVVSSEYILKICKEFQ